MVCAWQARVSKMQDVQSLAETPIENSVVISSPQWLWFALPMLGSVMLLATTNFLTQDVAPIPLLWVLPLCIYLLSFILTFHGTWYRRGLFHPLFAITASLVVLALFRGEDMRLTSQIAVYLLFLFVACMVCHGEVARLKPQARHLTSFYLLLSAGGAAGGIFVAIIAPSIFPTFWEYQLGLWAIALLLLVILFRDRTSWLHSAKPNLLVPIAALTLLLVVPKYLVHAGMFRMPTPFSFVYNFSLGLLISVCIWLAFTGGPNWARHRKFRWYEMTAIGSFLLLTTALCLQVNATNEYTYRQRNFYGAVAVYAHWDVDMIHVAYEFMHGRTIHGIQLTEDRKQPASYYGEGSGARLALLTNPQRQAGPMRVGAIGLGIGTIAAYARPGDVYRFYEINPEVIDLAQGKKGYFTYLQDSAARIEVVPGDARLSLEAEAARGDVQNFDVLFVDAFSGDSIPVHLLTKEAMALYLSHLRGPDSVIVVNVTNRAIDISPVVAGLAQEYGLKATLIDAPNRSGIFLRNDFILLTRGKSLDVPEVQKVGYRIRRDRKVPENRIWTDDYSNVARLLVNPLRKSPLRQSDG
jgi:spermidine synthase